MKNKITEMKNTLEGINRRLEDRRNGPVSGRAEWWKSLEFNRKREIL